MNKTTQWVVLWTVTEDFCETLQKTKSKTLSKNQERIPYAVPYINEELLLFTETPRGSNAVSKTTQWVVKWYGDRLYQKARWYNDKKHKRIEKPTSAKTVKARLRDNKESNVL